MVENKYKPKNKFYKKWWFWALIILFFIVLGSANKSNQQKSEVDASPDNLETVKNDSPDVYIDAYDIIRDYVDNTVVADSKYRDKTLEIRAFVSDIGKDLVDTPFLMLRGSKFTIEAIRCNFDRSDELLLAPIRKNQEIVVRGLVIGEKFGSVVLQNCEIIEQ